MMKMFNWAKAKQKGESTGVTMFGTFMLITVVLAIVLYVVVPLGITAMNSVNLSTALLKLSEEGYVAYGAPTGDWTTLGDLYTEDIYPQADSTWDIGAVGNEYNAGYFDTVWVGNASVARTATYVVAASDAPAHVIAQADYVCSGADDNVEIQAAIDAVGSWGKVQLTEGTYYIAAQINLNQASMWLCGSGVGVTSLFMPNGTNTNMLYITANEVILSDLSGDMNGTNQTAGVTVYLRGPTGVVVRNVEANNGFYNCVYVRDSTGVIIDNLIATTDKANCHLIQMNNSTWTTIINPQLDGGLAQGVYVHTSSHNTAIYGGVIKNLTGAASKGVYVDTTSDYVSVIGTAFYNMYNAVAHTGNYGLVNNCEANTIGTGNAFDISVGAQSKITNCTAMTVTSAGLCAEGDGQLVTGNTVIDAGIGGGFLNIDNSIISNNVIINSNGGAPYGIYLYGTATYNLVTGNRCYTDNATQTYGIRESAGTANTIIGNDVRGNITAGIYSAGTGTVVANNNGYIAPGEIRTISVAITAGVQNTVTSIQNTFGGDVLIIEAYVMISAAASATNPTYDMGTDDDGAGAPSVANNLFDAIPDTAAYYRALSNGLGGDASGVLIQPILWQAVGNDWVNFIIVDAAGADTAGVIYITVIGK